MIEQKHSPLVLPELKKMYKSRHVNTEHIERMTSLERFALFVTGKIGTMGFFFVLFVWTVIWIMWNTFAPSALRFDPFPGFILWLFVSNMVQLLLLPLIMIGQNLQSRHAEARAEADFEVNVYSEHEIETILQHLENQNDLILEILRKLEEK